MCWSSRDKVIKVGHIWSALILLFVVVFHCLRQWNTEKRGWRQCNTIRCQWLQTGFYVESAFFSTAFDVSQGFRQDTKHAGALMVATGYDVADAMARDPDRGHHIRRCLPTARVKHADSWSTTLSS